MQRFGDGWHKQGMTDEEGSDSAVLTGLRGQPELIGVLYERHAGAVFRFLVRRVGPGAAEDLLSEVFVAALGARTRVVGHDSGSALPWLYGIALNVVRHHLRRAAAPGLGLADPGMDWDAVATRLDAQAQRGQLRAALSALSPVERDLLLLVAWEGLTPGQAADTLGISKVAARSRLHRARQRAAQTLAAQPQPSTAIRSTWTTKEINYERPR
jgi:RNA polymerase sigma-70 factor (ECF subfamily)